MPRLKINAIIINARDYSESDRIISMLSCRQGLITAIAKGAKNSMKRFPGTLELFSEIEAEMFFKQGADILRLEEAKLINANLAIREDISIFAHASILLEFIYLNLAPLDPHPETYSILKRGLASMASEKKWFSFWAATLAAILRTIGYEIDVRGTILQRDLIQLERISGEALVFLERSEKLDYEMLSRLQVSPRAMNEITFCLTSLCQKVSGKSLRTVDFLREIII